MITSQTFASFNSSEIDPLEVSNLTLSDLKSESQLDYVNSLDDLLAVESARWLQIGKPKDALELHESNTTSRTAPYETSLNITESTNFTNKSDDSPIHQAPLRPHNFQELKNSHQPPPLVWPSIVPLVSWHHPLTWTSIQLNQPPEPINNQPNRWNITSEFDSNKTGTFNFSRNFPSLSTKTTDEDQFEGAMKDTTGKKQSSNWTQVIQKQSELGGDLESFMVTNRSIVTLQCDTNHMVVQLRFQDPFYGRIQTDLDPGEACFVLGNGNKTIEWRIALRDCGTRQEGPRLFINNLKIYFQKSNSSSDLSSLDSDEEQEMKTIVCSYPLKPIAYPPSDLNTGIAGLNISGRIVEQLLRPEISQPARLTEYEPLMLVAGAMVIAMALLSSIGGFVLARRYHQRQRQGKVIKLSNSRQPFESARMYPNFKPNDSLNDSSLTKPSPFMRPPLLSWSRRTAKLSRKQPVRVRRLDLLDDIPTRKLDDSRRKRKAVVKRPLGVLNKEEITIPSRDSLAESSSVTLIEIPFVSPKEKQSQINPTARPHPESYRSRPTETSGRPSSPQKKATKYDGIAEKDISSPEGNRIVGPRLGSIRKTLTSPAEFNRLRRIEELFADGNREDQSGASVTSQSHGRILDHIELSERQLLREKLGSDELFRSHVIQARDLETFSKKLKRNPRYENQFKPETWNYLEKIIVEPISIGSSSDDYPATITTTSVPQQNPRGFDAVSDDVHVATLRSSSPRTKTAGFQQQKPRSFGLEARRSDIRHSEVEDESLDETSRVEHKASDLNSSDSLEFSETGGGAQGTIDNINGSVNRKVDKQNDRIAASNSIRTTDGNVSSSIRMSQLSTSKSSNKRGYGLGDTLIEIDSVTNIKSSDNFTTYTRSSIEHRRYKGDSTSSSSSSREAYSMWSSHSPSYLLDQPSD